MKKKNITIWLTILLVVLCLTQVFVDKYFYKNENIVIETDTDEKISEDDDGDVNEVTKYNEEKTLTQADEIKKGIETSKKDIYGNTSYMFNNSCKFMERLKTEVNNMANDKSDNNHLYDVAESIRINAINYYSILNGCYEEGNEEIVESCKAYIFNAEIMAYNMMQFIKQGKTEYISRTMICISAEEDLIKNFRAAEKNFMAKNGL